MRLNETVRSEMEKAVLCWLATVGGDGDPNVSPKEIFAPFAEDDLVIADIASPISVRNIRLNPKVCVSFIDVFRQCGFKLAGEASVIGRDGEDFADFAAPLLSKAGTAFEIRHVIHVRVERVSRIWAPSYAVFPNRSEQERLEEAYRTYGVQPRSA